MARGGASRLGLKRIIGGIIEREGVGGSWRGFPPGIETKVPTAIVGVAVAVARGGASRLGLKRIVLNAEAQRASWWLVEGLPAWD